MISRQTWVAPLFVILAISAIFVAPHSIGHNENQAPVHSHTSTSSGWSTCFSPKVESSTNGDCTTIMVCALFRYTSITTCTHGVEESS